jgi:hypothetical protein
VSRVYSQQLIYGLSMGAGTTTIGGPPSGTLWVLRHMTAYADIDIVTRLYGFTLELDETLPLWTLGGFGIPVATSFHWSGRAVVNPGQALTFTTADPASPGWNLVAHGYALALP